MESNDFYFRRLQSEFGKFSDIVVENNKVYYQNQVIDLEKVKLQSIFQFGSNSMNACHDFDSSELFSFLQVEVFGKKNLFKEEKAFDTLRGLNPKMKDISMGEFQNQREEVKKYVHLTSSYNVQEVSEDFQNEMSYSETVGKETIIFLSERQFLSLLHNEKEYSKEEEQQMNLYYGFLFKLMKYRDYLTEDLYLLLVHYENEIQVVVEKASTGVLLNNNEMKAEEKYYEMDEKVKTQHFSVEKSNVLKFTRNLPKAGFTQSMILTILTCVLGVLLAIVLLK